MPSTYTTRNRLEKQAPGENSNTWGQRLNEKVFDLVDFALDGMTSFALSTTKTLTDEDGAADEARARYLNITGGTGGTITIPNVEKLYLVRNASSGTVTITTGSGTTATVSASDMQWVVCEGGNVVRATSALTASAAATLTNKSINLANNTVTTTYAELNTAISDADVPSLTSTNTLTNKRVTPRVNAQTTTSSPWGWNSDSYDQQSFSALANALTISVDAGTPTDGQKAVLRFKDNGSSRTITFTGGSSKAFRDCSGQLTSSGSDWTLATTNSKTSFVGCIYNGADSRWDVVAVVTEP